MKMRFAGFLMFTILSVSILSYGFSSSAFADSHDIPPISVKTELPTYENGDRVLVDGTIRDFDLDIHSGTGLTYRITDSTGNIVTIGQVLPNSDGAFSFNFIAGGSQNLFVPFILDSIDRAFWTTRVFAVCRK